MKVQLNKQTNLLEVTLAKPEQKKLSDAWDLCQTLARLDPVDSRFKRVAGEAMQTLAELCKECGAFSEEEV